MHDVGDRARIFAARMRLQSALDQADALDGIREIAGNLIGTEEIAVFKVDTKRVKLWLYWSFGVDPNKHSVLDVTSEPGLKQVLAGRPMFQARSSTQNLLSCDDPVSALVPILVDGTVVAVLVLFRLFSHKSELQSVDQEICEVLSNCAGRAIEPYHAR